MYSGDLVVDLTVDGSSIAAQLQDSLSAAVIGDKKVVFGSVSVVGTNVSAATLSAVLANLEYVVGGLTLGPGLTFAERDGAVALAGLAEVGGGLTVHPSETMASLELRALTDVGGGLSVDGGESLASFLVPKLVTVGGLLRVEASNEMTSLMLPRLTEVGGAFTLFGGATLVTFNAPSLTAVNTVTVYSLNSTLTATFGSLKSANMSADDIRSVCFECTVGELGTGVITADRTWPPTGLPFFADSILFDDTAELEHASFTMAEWMSLLGIRPCQKCLDMKCFFSKQPDYGRDKGSSHCELCKHEKEECKNQCPGASTPEECMETIDASRVPGENPLLYRASDHGFDVSQMWPRVRNQGPTIMLVSANGYLFGGVSDHTWMASDGRYIASTKSFLFTLRAPHNERPTRYPVIPNNGNAMYDASSYCKSARSVVHSFVHMGHKYKLFNPNHPPVAADAATGTGL